MQQVSIPSTRLRVPSLVRGQLAEVDQVMFDDLGSSQHKMMERAGHCLTHGARTLFLGDEQIGRRVVVLAGSGGNGLAAMICAGCLDDMGIVVSVYTTQALVDIPGRPASQATILAEAGIVVRDEGLPSEGRCDLIIDGLLGHGLHGAPHGRSARLIDWANAQAKVPVLSLDLPSGLDPTTGALSQPTVRASATLALGLPTAGLRAPGAKGVVGDLLLANIGVPTSVYEQSGLNARRLFSRSNVVRIA